MFPSGAFTDFQLSLKNQGVDLQVGALTDIECRNINPTSLGLPSDAISKRVRERAAALQLLHLIPALASASISRNTDGMPYIAVNNSGNSSTAVPPPFLSISHSRQFCAVAVSPQPIGIDLEEPSPKLSRVADKFLNPAEALRFTSLNDLLRVWTIKEAVYKLFSSHHLPLADIDVAFLDDTIAHASCASSHGQLRAVCHTFRFSDGTVLTVSLSA